MNQRWNKLVPAALVVVAMTTAACGGEDEEAATSAAAAAAEGATTAAGEATQTDTAAAEGGEGKTVKVVSDLPLQGASGAQAKTLVQAEELFLERLGGKAGAYTVEFESKDDSTAAAGKWDPGTCTDNANEYSEDESLVAVVGTFNSGCAELMIPILNESSTAMVSPANTAVGLTHAGPGSKPGEPDKFYPSGTRNYARVVPSDDFQGAAVAQLMQKLGVKNVYILHDKQIYGKGVADAAAAASEKLGIKVLANEGYDPKAPNYDAIMEKIKGQNAEAVFLGAIIDNNGAQVVKDKVKVLGDNEKVKLIGPDGMFVNLLPTAEGAGKAAEGMYLTFGGLGPDQIKERGGKAAEFLTTYEEKYGKPEVYTVYGAAAMQAALKAIEASDGTKESVTEQLLQVKIPKDESLLGEEFGFNENGDTTLVDMSVFRAKGEEIPFDQAIEVDEALLEG
jgi:branched-chain amino acid transport system substrate-binding protein